MNANLTGPASDAADLWRDAWGIPHIKTRTRDEAFTALGFAHARDRLWQMEALLRRGTGRYAEWVGKAGLRGDMLALQVDVAGASQRDFAALSAGTRAMLESYTRGVNAFIATGHRPIEYRLLGVEPFAPAGRRGRAVAVTGVLIPEADVAALNVTSMYRLQATCP